MVTHILAGGLRYVTRLQPPEEVQLADYLAWSEEHLEQSDPLNRIWLPRGERPDLTYEEWRDWKRQHPQRY